MKDVARLAGVS
ncbi:hypothetical protein OQ351_002826, partial [Escherichia coli]|nr:hypothetical protein [Escherichia coli]